MSTAEFGVAPNDIMCYYILFKAPNSIKIDTTDYILNATGGILYPYTLSDSTLFQNNQSIITPAPSNIVENFLSGLSVNANRFFLSPQNNGNNTFILRIPRNNANNLSMRQILNLAKKYNIIQLVTIRPYISLAGNDTTIPQNLEECRYNKPSKTLTNKKRLIFFTRNPFIARRVCF